MANNFQLQDKGQNDVHSQSTHLRARPTTENLSEFCNILKYLSLASVAKLVVFAFGQRPMNEETNRFDNILVRNGNSTLLNATCVCKTAEGNVYTIIFPR
jgi:hypothetical protein